MKRLYITDQNPNGTHHLMVFDDDIGEIVDGFDEAVFGLCHLFNKIPDGEVLCANNFDDFIYEETPDYENFFPVVEIDYETAMKHIAVCPGNDGSEIEDAIADLRLNVIPLFA